MRQTDVEGPPRGLAEFIDTMLARNRGQDTIRTGLSGLDGATSGGLRKGQLAVLAGPSGVGTSVLALGIARHAAVRDRNRTVLLAPDAAQSEILSRLIAAEARVPVERIRTGLLGIGDEEKIAATRASLESAPLVISSEWPLLPPMVLHEVGADYGRLGFELAVVDWTPGSSEDVWGLKAVAQQFNLAVVVTVTARPPTTYPGPQWPSFAWLREQAALIEVADLVVAVDRNDLQDARSTRAGEAELTLLKHRYGPTLLLPPILFQGRYARFVEPTAG